MLGARVSGGGDSMGLGEGDSTGVATFYSAAADGVGVLDIGIYGNGLDSPSSDGASTYICSGGDSTG